MRRNPTTGEWEDDETEESGITQDWTELDKIGHLEENLVPMPQEKEEKKYENPTPWKGL